MENGLEKLHRMLYKLAIEHEYQPNEHITVESDTFKYRFENGKYGWLTIHGMNYSGMFEYSPTFCARMLDDKFKMEVGNHERSVN